MSIRSFCVAFFGACCLMLNAQAEAEVKIQSFQGQEASVYQDQVTNLLKTVFEAPPYRYFAQNWDGYVQEYIENPASFTALAFDDDKVVGVAIGTPLKDAKEKYQAAMAGQAEELNSLYYLGDLAVDDAYRDLGIAKRLYTEFESLVTKTQLYAGICLWQLASESKSDVGKFWKKQGFKLYPKIHFQEIWREDPVPSSPKLPHEMVFWKKKIG
jgi:GNAT superfamily N-acetyltransferase